MTFYEINETLINLENIVAIECVSDGSSHAISFHSASSNMLRKGFDSKAQRDLEYEKIYITLKGMGVL